MVEKGAEKRWGFLGKIGLDIGLFYLYSGGMIWNSLTYEAAITQWLIDELKKRAILETRFSRDAGLGKSETDARTFRKIKEGKRHWSVVDLIKIANYFNEDPSKLMEQVEAYYQANDVQPALRTARRIMGESLTRIDTEVQLISTWRRQNDDVVLVDCDANWRKITRGDISLLIGLPSARIFPDYPEVTSALNQAWESRGQNVLEFWYQLKTPLDHQLLESDAPSRFLHLRALYAPAEYVVVYVTDITDTNNNKGDLQWPK